RSRRRHAVRLSDVGSSQRRNKANRCTNCNSTYATNNIHNALLALFVPRLRWDESLSAHGTMGPTAWKESLAARKKTSDRTRGGLCSNCFCFKALEQNLLHDPVCLARTTPRNKQTALTKTAKRRTWLPIVVR